MAGGLDGLLANGFGIVGDGLNKMLRKAGVTCSSVDEKTGSDEEISVFALKCGLGPEELTIGFEFVAIGHIYKMKAKLSGMVPVYSIERFPVRVLRS